MAEKDYYGAEVPPQNTYYTDGPSTISVPPQAYGAPPPVNGNSPVSCSNLLLLSMQRSLIQIGNGLRSSKPRFLSKFELDAVLPIATTILHIAVPTTATPLRYRRSRYLWSASRGKDGWGERIYWSCKLLSFPDARWRVKERNRRKV